MTGNYSQTGQTKEVQHFEKQTTEQAQAELRETQEQLQQAKKEIDDLKEQALADIKELWCMFSEYDKNRKEFESEIKRQASEREERTSSQFGWGQAVSFVPVFSHAYNLATSKANELVEREESRHRDLLCNRTKEVYQKAQESYEKMKERYGQK
jgi:hypothetical protein